MRSPAEKENKPLFEYTLMPTHMRKPFAVDELQNIELANAFNFTKGCQTLKISTHPWNSGFEHGTMLFDLEIDPKQENPLTNLKIESQLIDKMVRLMEWNDAPPEQYERIGIKRVPNV